MIRFSYDNWRGDSNWLRVAIIYDLSRVYYQRTRFVLVPENKLQILANLGNFAYDPINYEYFRQLNILDLFIGKCCRSDSESPILHHSIMYKSFFFYSADVVAEEDEEKMVEYAIGGICNCCLDKLNKAYLVENEGVEMVAKCLSRSGTAHTDSTLQ